MMRRKVSHKISTCFESEKLSFMQMDSLKNIETKSTKKEISHILRTLSKQRQLEMRKLSNNFSKLYNISGYGGNESIAEES